jgi:hypothetical protein
LDADAASASKSAASKKRKREAVSSGDVVEACGRLQCFFDQDLAVRLFRVNGRKVVVGSDWFKLFGITNPNSDVYGTAGVKLIRDNGRVRIVLDRNGVSHLKQYFQRRVQHRSNTLKRPSFVTDRLIPWMEDVMEQIDCLDEAKREEEADESEEEHNRQKRIRESQSATGLLVEMRNTPPSTPAQAHAIRHIITSPIATPVSTTHSSSVINNANAMPMPTDGNPIPDMTLIAQKAKARKHQIELDREAVLNGTHPFTHQCIANIRDWEADLANGDLYDLDVTIPIAPETPHYVVRMTASLLKERGCITPNILSTRDTFLRFRYKIDH